MRRISPVLLLLLLAWPSNATAKGDGEPIRLPESVALTPDAQTLVFSWRGDLWRASAQGGTAKRLTFHPAADTRPHVSPDGTKIAFSSTRSGVEQVHVMGIDGGTPRQVTQHSESARAYGWFPDGTALLIRSKRDHHWRASDRLFRKPLDIDARPELLFDAECGHGAVSPNGRLLAFTREGMGWTRKGYRGARASQLWLFDLQEKTFKRLSEGDHGELWPQWGPDSDTLYYVSEQDGTWNLWQQHVGTGKRKPLTKHTDDGATWPSIAANGKTIVYRRLFDIYTVSTAGKASPKQIEITDPGDPTIDAIERRTLTRATACAFTDDAREIAFVAGGDVWVMDTELREPRRVTSTAAEERDPVFSKDFNTLWFVSDAAGQPDVWKVSRSDDTRYWWQNDQFKAQRVTKDALTEEDLRLTPDGKRLAYVKEGGLWSMATDGSDARKHVDSFLGVEWTFSPDGRWIAYATPDNDFNWDVWITAADGSKEAVNVSRHPDNDHAPAWSPDGKVLAFTGRRWTEETDICYVWLRAEDDQTQKRDRTLEKALKKMKGRKAPGKGKGAGKTKGAGSGKSPTPAGAPTGLAGRWAGRLSGPEPLPTDGLDLSLEVTKTGEATWACTLEVVGQFSGPAETFEHDPDAGTFSFALTTPLGPLQGEGRLAEERITGTWKIEAVMEGTFEASREQTAPAMSETPTSGAAEAEKAPGKADKAKEAPEPTPVEIDFEGLADRIERISIPDAAESDLLWSHDSKKLAFRGKVQGKAGLYAVEFPDKLTPKLLTTARGSHARWLKQGNQIVWLSGGTPAALSAGGKPTPYRFRTRQEVLLPDLHAAVFDQAWRTMRDTYYDDQFGGRDWEAVRAKYRAMAKECLTSADLGLVINMMLGELNGSHLGFRSSGRTWSRTGWRDVTGHLGCRFDSTWDGEGLKVRDVVRGTPAAAARSRIEAGEIVVSIDARPVGPATNLGRLLTGDPERTLDVQVKALDGTLRTVSLRPTSYATVRRRLYDDWIRGTQAKIDEASGGAVGYLHVRSMNWSSFLRFEAELYKVGHGKDALIIDVRDNGGGFTTDHLLTCLAQPRHAITKPRRGGRGYPNDRMVYAPWSKPVIVLCNQNSFSNAEIFSHAIKTMKRGTVVGVQTAGGVISTGSTSIMGFGSLRLPFRGWYLLNDGEDMELNGCLPHHTIWPRPEDHASGRDRQVEKAVDVAQEAIKAWKARPQPKLRKASERPGFGGR